MIGALTRNWYGRPAGLVPSAARRLTATGERRKGTASWSALGLAAQVYVVAVTVAGGFAIALAMAHVGDYNLWLFAVLTLLAVAASIAKVSLPVPHSGSTLTICYVLDFTTLLVLGPHAATLTAALGAWSQCTLRRREATPVFHTWFSVGALGLTVQAAGLAYSWLGGHPVLPVAEAFPIDALLAASAVFFIVNSLLVAMAVALSTGQSTARVWVASYLWSWPGHLVGFGLAVGAAYSIGRSTLWLIPFAMVSLALTYENFKAYVTRFTDSVTDPLTGLPNLRHLKVQAAQELARSQRDHTPMALLLIDLDGFKGINDTFGHGAGDKALREVAQCLQQSLRLYDVCARYGGDEFVAVLPGCDADDAQRKASLLQAAVSALRLQLKSETVALHISVGVAAYPDDGDGLDALLAVADARMFADKEGRTAARQPRGGRRGSRTAGSSAGGVDPALQQQILEAQRLEAVGQLAGGVAHDFNNALTAILGYSDLLTEQIGPDKPIGRDLKEIVGAAQHAASLTHQLLAFSRKQTLSSTEVDLNDVVTVADAMLRRLIGERVRIVTELSDDLRSVMGNLTQFEQVVVNLCVNARDAMPDGGVLTIATRNLEVHEDALPHPTAKAGTYAQLVVSDTGIGMSDEIRHQIFDVFFTTKEPGKGTGLGLAAVHGIVTQLGGFIGVASEVGVGTTFTISLPSTDHVASVRAIEPPPSAQPVAVGVETILLVEDEPAVRQFASVALERHGYRVLEAHSAEAALVLLDRVSGPIHLVMTDIGLPGIDGCELATRVERERPGVRILFTTGYNDVSAQRTRVTAGVSELLEKPFTARALLDKTREVLDREVA